MAVQALIDMLRVRAAQETDAVAHESVDPSGRVSSGSTGTPKGVLIPQRSVHRQIAWMQDTYRLQPADRVRQKTPYGFDLSVWELFWPLASGATLVLATPGGHRDPECLHRLIASQGVTRMHFVPTVLQAFLDAVTTLTWNSSPPDSTKPTLPLTASSRLEGSVSEHYPRRYS